MTLPVSRSAARRALLLPLLLAVPAILAAQNGRAAAKAPRAMQVGDWYRVTNALPAGHVAGRPAGGVHRDHRGARRRTSGTQEVWVVPAAGGEPVRYTVALHRELEPALVARRQVPASSTRNASRWQGQHVGAAHGRAERRGGAADRLSRSGSMPRDGSVRGLHRARPTRATAAAGRARRRSVRPHAGAGAPALRRDHATRRSGALRRPPHRGHAHQGNGARLRGQPARGAA